MILIIVSSLDLLLGQIMISKHALQSFICRPLSKSHKIHFDATMQPLLPSLDSHFSQVRVSTLFFLFLLCCISSLGRRTYSSGSGGGKGVVVMVVMVVTVVVMVAVAVAMVVLHDVGHLHQSTKRASGRKDGTMVSAVESATAT
jgi:hypothetical protein